jgi:biopolymer transport protein ExbD
MAAVSRIRAEQPESAVLIEVADEARHGTVVLIWDEMKANNIPVSITRTSGARGITDRERRLANGSPTKSRASG